MKYEIGNHLHCIKDLKQYGISFTKGKNYIISDVRAFPPDEYNKQVSLFGDNDSDQWFLTNVRVRHFCIPQYFKSIKEIRYEKLKIILNLNENIRQKYI